MNLSHWSMVEVPEASTTTEVEEHEREVIQDEALEAIEFDVCSNPLKILFVLPCGILSICILHFNTSQN